MGARLVKIDIAVVDEDIRGILPFIGRAGNSVRIKTKFEDVIELEEITLKRMLACLKRELERK